ncbi:RNA polymerase sigma-70 factor [Bacteroides oleiciplenus]|uniref:RNA polymerase sigma-70 factor n=1 Tax=Bacteroides oleiciplenus TaxID=626931 RepID=A0A3E5B5Z2_9BACE|nr:RNA polymerase sigma-70 factor [Bacteroides oleiciplenus]RGN32934.1 RNA polymerase sigma-70 factor [Bacteroides oleiciplenus]
MSIYLDFDTELCMELQQGKEEAFSKAFSQYSRLLYALAYRFLKSGEEAEDAVQYVFMKLWEERKRLDFRTGVRSLLYTIMKNHILNELRHRQLVYEKNYLISQEAEKTDDGFLKAYEEQNLREQLILAINKLPSQKSTICMMKLKKGLSNQEIADRMHITVATVKSHYTQAIKMLRQEFVAVCMSLMAFLGLG